ncbi:hypothetical protein FPV67DRAFT_1451433 [Lyophyllum atratum]|nr:hypothetical protein FPV67DRAFT_1451433 [Lyophyllum atratum]
MCKHEVVGDFYRGCGHFHGRYFTGETKDCKSEECRTSVMHKHKTARNCRCPEVIDEERKSIQAYNIALIYDRRLEFVKGLLQNDELELRRFALLGVADSRHGRSGTHGFGSNSQILADLPVRISHEPDKYDL